MACLQEARTLGPCTRILEHILCIVSGREPGGAYSCETWIARKLPLKGTDRSIVMTTDVVITLEMDPRFLYVRLRAPPLLMDVINCHVAHKKHDKVPIKIYWGR